MDLLTLAALFSQFVCGSSLSAQENIALYARQWRLELCLRDLKTTMGLEQLRCKSPDLAEKELLACLVAPSLHAQLLIRENEMRRK